LGVVDRCDLFDCFDFDDDDPFYEKVEPVGGRNDQLILAECQHQFGLYLQAGFGYLMCETRPIDMFQ
jgi:hypothetical protein